jgi:hypothetical protein
MLVPIIYIQNRYNREFYPVAEFCNTAVKCWVKVPFSADGLRKASVSHKLLTQSKNEDGCPQWFVKIKTTGEAVWFVKRTSDSVHWQREFHPVHCNDYSIFKCAKE